MRRLVWSGVVLAVSAGAAWADAAQLEPRHFVARRLAADLHLQLAIQRVEAAGADSCRVEGTAVRVFPSRDDHFKVGTPVMFTLPCAADSFWPADKLKTARLIEAFLKSSPAGLEIADQGQGMREIAAATDRPVVQDDPVLVREMKESLARYRIEAEAKRGMPSAALALTQDDDPVLQARLLGYAAGIFASKGQSEAQPTFERAMAALSRLATPDQRLDAGLSVMESLAFGGAKEPTLAVADWLAPQVTALGDPGRRDEALLMLYGARARAGAPKSALAALAEISDPAIRRDRLETVPYALKGFATTATDSPAWFESLLQAAESQPDPSFRQEAVAALCRTGYAAISDLVQHKDRLAEAAQLAQSAARRRHTPSALLLAAMHEAGEGAAKSREQAAHWYAVAASGFGGDAASRANAVRQLATFTPAERKKAEQSSHP
jgi:TPR repeat protein